MAEIEVPPEKPRQAVIVIHGIAEQRPMQALRGFIRGVIGGDRKPDGSPAYYSRPDPNADSFELRRFRVVDEVADTDFMEFYWQHLMPPAGGRFVLGWLAMLMRRPVGAVPPRFRLLWGLGWAIALAAAVLALIHFGAALFGLPSPLPSLGKLGAAAALVGSMIWGAVRFFVGDSAIYLNSSPATVDARNAIRVAGVALLERLHQDGRYGRIILVGHSLGSVIAYDIVAIAWQRAAERWRGRVQAGTLGTPEPKQPQLAAATALAAGDEAALRQSWHRQTRAVLAEQQAAGLEWIVTDLVTLGSPLAYADFLLAQDEADFVRRAEERELAWSPPVPEAGLGFSFERQGRSPDGTPQRAHILHHAAQFAVTGWTNIYFPGRAFVRGDALGGPVAPLFGDGVRDVPVHTELRGGPLSHSLYWTRTPTSLSDPDSPILALRDALDLERKSFPRRGRGKASKLPQAGGAEQEPQP